MVTTLTIYLSHSTFNTLRIYFEVCYNICIIYLTVQLLEMFINNLATELSLLPFTSLSSINNLFVLMLSFLAIVKHFAYMKICGIHGSQYFDVQRKIQCPYFSLCKVHTIRNIDNNSLKQLFTLNVKRQYFSPQFKVLNVYILSTQLI